MTIDPQLNLAERWDSAKLDMRVQWAIRGRWITKNGRLTRTGKRIAESKWDDLSLAARRIMEREIVNDCQG